ncbi:MAG: hypothetical protein AABM29_06875 [Actinomycetota bacterium]
MAFTEGEQPPLRGRHVIAAAAALPRLSLPVAIGARHADSAAAKAKKSAPPPNVLIIETDDQDIASLRVMPNVQELIGDHGVTFPNSFVNYSLCCPSRSTMLTG